MTLTLGTHNLRYTPSDWPSLVFLPLSKLTITPHAYTGQECSTTGD